MNRLVKIRKLHSCWHCGGDIQVGEKAMFHKIRSARYGSPKDLTDPDDKGEQVGIEYLTYYTHHLEGPNGLKCEAKHLECDPDEVERVKEDMRRTALYLQDYYASKL